MPKYKLGLPNNIILQVCQLGSFLHLNAEAKPDSKMLYFQVNEQKGSKRNTHTHTHIYIRREKPVLEYSRPSSEA